MASCLTCSCGALRDRTEKMNPFPGDDMRRPAEVAAAAAAAGQPWGLAVAVPGLYASPPLSPANLPPAAPAVPACGRPGVGGRKALRANEGDGRHEFQSHRRRTETARTKRTAEMSAKRIAGAETLSEICLEVRN